MLWPEQRHKGGPEIRLIASITIIVALLIPTALGVSGCRRPEPSSPSAQGAGAEEKIAQKLCPVTGHPIDKNLYVDYQGQRIYLCCRACVSLFQEDPERYLQKLEAPLQGSPAVPEAL